MRRRTINRGGFTLIEIMIAVTIIGTMSAMVVPSFFDAGADSAEAALRGQLQRLRVQIEVYRASTAGDPGLLVDQWDDLVDGDYLHGRPINPLNESDVVAAAPGAGVGWVWRDKGNGTLGLFATDETMLAEFSG